MASWDTVVSLKSLLDEYSRATGDSYILIVAQGTEETPRVIAKAAAALPDNAGPHIFGALEGAASDIFDEIALGLGLEEDDDGPPLQA